MEPMYYVSYYLELQNQLAAPKGSFQKLLFDGPADQERDSLRPDQTPVDASAIDQAKMKPSRGDNSLTPLDTHDILIAVSEEVNFDWPHSLAIERIKAGLTETALAVLLFVGLVAFCLQRF